MLDVAVNGETIAAIEEPGTLEKMSSTVDALHAGQSGVELRIPLIFHPSVQSGRPSVNRFVELVSTNPAKIHGLYPGRGFSRSGATRTSP
jgi:dihydroorotase-like cyclic amidohydrolase